MLSQKDQILLILNALVIYLGVYTLNRAPLASENDNNAKYWGGVLSITFGVLSIISLLMSCSHQGHLVTIAGLNVNYFHAASLVAFLLSAYNNYIVANASTGNDKTYTWLNILLHLAVVVVFLFFEPAKNRYDAYKSARGMSSPSSAMRVSSPRGSAGAHMLNEYTPRPAVRVY